jgi:hypothetical protein
MIQPPTDNLYKFLAIFGLIVFGFSWYLPLQHLAENSREVAKWNAAWGPLLVREQQSDDSARAELECAIADAKMREAGKQPLESEECTLVKRARQQSQNEQKNLDVATAELRGGLATLDYLHSQAVLYLWLGVCFGLAGLIMCITGFWFWYLRLQRYLDADAASTSRRPT